MSLFGIVQIGEDIEPTWGVPEGCDLCGHCRVLSDARSQGAPLPCGAASASTEPLVNRPSHTTASRSDSEAT